MFILLKEETRQKLDKTMVGIAIANTILAGIVGYIINFN